MTLNDLAIKHVTDKWDNDGYGHAYCSIYESIFDRMQNDPIKLLEIGIEDGGSIRMWRDYFSYGRIYGIDIIDCGQQGERTKCFIADQGKPEHLHEVMERIGAMMDFIIDDGSHALSDILISLRTLYPYLKEGGFYFIEDLEHPRRDLEEHLQGYDYWFATSKSKVLNSNIIIIRKP